MRKTTKLLFGLLVTAALQSSGPAAGQSFLANNGVLYEATSDEGGATVVVDGLFRFYRDIYPPLPDSLRLAFEAAESPFDDVAFVLATHRHGDHMHPEAIASFLCAAPEAVALVPEEIRDEVEAAAGCGAAADRLVTGTEAVERGGVTVRAVPVPHVNPDRFASIQNRAYVIESASGRIVHLGDSDLSEELAAESIDVLTTPFWNIGEDRFMRLWERAGRPYLIAVHVSPGDHERLRSRYRELGLDVWVPELPLETGRDRD
ncbi:MAG: MBL fold metallo-hydrolase [Rhodothermales bacterium]|nr:MBL fold metallo-hydrolase [Rhodothermales bacterium]